MFKQVSFFYTPNRTYTRKFLHQRTFSPEEALHQTVFTSGTFDTKGFLDQKSFPPQAPHTKEFIYIYTYAYTRKLLQKNTTAMSTAGTFYTKGVLHHRQSAPKSLYTQRLLQQTNCTKQFLRRATFTPEDVYT